MDQRFSMHNTHLKSVADFPHTDPQLSQLQLQKYVYKSPLLDEFPVQIPGIYTLGGSRQIGKSTLLKQWIQNLLHTKVAADAIAYFTGELIDDHHMLVRLLQNHLAEYNAENINYIIIDEITYIKDWDKAIKFLADGGLLRQTILMLTGSDLSLIKDARLRFPGRRGIADKTNFHQYPLSFQEYIALTNKDKDDILIINQGFKNYLQHGGFLTAINNFDIGKIYPATYATYTDWICGDVMKRGKKEKYLREILTSVIKRYNSQVSWNALAKDLSIDHPQTVAEYIDVLESMDAVFVQHALLEDKLVAAPKKAKKIMFTDPFIYHAICLWLDLPKINMAQQESHLVEAVVVTHIRRHYPTYYIKAEGEVDVAYIKDRKFWPIEIKWTQQLRPKDLKQIAKYNNGRIFAKIFDKGKINGVPAENLPMALLNY